MRVTQEQAHGTLARETRNHDGVAVAVARSADGAVGQQRATIGDLELVSNSPPDKTGQLAAALRRVSGAQNVQSLASWAANPRAKGALTKLVTAWRGVGTPSAELAAMLPSEDT